MPLPRRRISLLLISAIAFSLIGAPAVAARSISSANAPTAVAPAALTGAATLTGTLPRRIDLPDGFMPEGIESGPFGRLYVGSRADGAIWKGNAYTGRGRILVEGVEGRFAAGVYLDWRNRLWVAGGGNGTVRVYNARTGDLLRTYQFPTPSFINDLTIVDNKVYATDSLNQYLAVVPLGRYGRLPSTDKARTLALTGDISYSAGFNANGITKKYGWLILVQSNEGLLFRVNPRTGVARSIDTGGYLVTNGDGIEVRDRWLYVVRNQNNIVPVFRLNWNIRRATRIGDITSPPAPNNLDVPTTATFAAGKLWAVNARFGVTDPETADYWITRLPLKPPS